jgi:hypothetical protein
LRLLAAAVLTALVLAAVILRARFDWLELGMSRRRTAYRAWVQPDWFRGIWWWDWSVDGGDPDGGGFTPEGKLAERVVAGKTGPQISVSASASSEASSSRSIGATPSTAQSSSTRRIGAPSGTTSRSA